MSKKIQLLKKTSRSFLIYGLIAMILSIVVLFFVTRYIIHDETAEKLSSTVYRIEKLLEDNGNLVNVEPIIFTDRVEELKPEFIKDTLIYDPAEGELEIFKEFTKYKRINEVNYRISARTMVVESEDIIIAILISYVAIFLLVFIMQYFLNRRMTSSVWKPFFNNLNKLKGFSIQSNELIKFDETYILEFTELNDELKVLTDKVVSDYQNLKQFTEDVSHEIQTPLAIIQAKIDNLFDENHISENQYRLLVDISNNTRRLASLNKKLILLTKIENKQFEHSKKINFTNVVINSIKDFEGISEISLSYDKLDILEVHFDDYLARILADNLISNALKYTNVDGDISVSILNRSFIVTNSGDEAVKNPEKLYNRFYKENDSKKSLGLGLAVVKKICDNYSFQISYSFAKGRHVFRIDFN